MHEALIVTRQVLVMFLIMALGWMLGRKNMIEAPAIGTLNHLVMYIAGPCIMVQSFCQPFTISMLENLGMAFILATAVMLIATLTGRLIFSRKESIQQFAVIFNNCGFIGIPLVQSVLGEEAILNLTILLAVWNLFSWTYGYGLLDTNPGRHVQWKRVLLNPATISAGVGLVLFFGQIPLPDLLDTTLGYLGGMNTPLAMLVLGYSLSRISVKSMFSVPHLLKTTLLRLLVIPLISLACFSLVPARFNLVRTTMMIAASTPTGATLTMFLHMLHKDASDASVLVAFTTICSIVTIPLVLLAMSLLWQM